MLLYWDWYAEDYDFIDPFFPFFLEEEATSDSVFLTK